MDTDFHSIQEPESPVPELLGKNETPTESQYKQILSFLKEIKKSRLIVEGEIQKQQLVLEHLLRKQLFCVLEH